ncbi:hypothetical protein BD779DRAFT_1471040 [Infundibulicybe gibba]|nr:hypothetical protein BD779DRAFT_1471040 [Infundibulicybe gibba]
MPTPVTTQPSETIPRLEDIVTNVMNEAAIPLESRHTFHTFADFCAFVEKSHRALRSSGCWYIGITGFSMENLTRFDEIRDTLPPVRVTYYADYLLLILKLVG